MMRPMYFGPFPRFSMAPLHPPGLSCDLASESGTWTPIDSDAFQASTPSFDTLNYYC